MLIYTDRYNACIYARVGGWVRLGEGRGRERGGRDEEREGGREEGRKGAWGEKRDRESEKEQTILIEREAHILARICW